MTSKEGLCKILWAPGEHGWDQAMVENSWTKAVLNLENKIKPLLNRALLLSSSSSGITPYSGRPGDTRYCDYSRKTGNTDFYLTYL